ncbi:hypothetical protein DPMN_133482 [Dreissena polymorpha]|uniref:Uncharacterized protein n=1 Tax=Dreissena polymorpha TaxID=45954 RepID=A0A9D4FVM5_DREPO|nr:hypothetical protein DPMN_133482 [Dreissena polymorpha]
MINEVFCMELEAYVRPQVKAESGSRKANPVLVGTLVPIAVVIGVGGLIAASVIIYRKRMRPVNERLTIAIQETGDETTNNDEQETEPIPLKEIRLVAER